MQEQHAADFSANEITEERPAIDALLNAVESEPSDAVAMPTNDDMIKVALMARIADLEVVLEDVIGIHKRVGGFMKARDQQLFVRAMRVQSGEKLERDANGEVI
jgi:hypothetical protein